jgi:outer membrane protein assembly factor BamB
MAFHDGQHSGTSSEVLKPPMTLAWKWTDPLDYDNGRNEAPEHTFIPIPAFWMPIYSKGKLYLQGGQNANRLFALNAVDGTAAWENDNPGYAQNGNALYQFDNYPAAVTGRMVYVSTDFTASVSAADGTGYLNVYMPLGGWPFGGIAADSTAAYPQYIRTDDNTEEVNVIPQPANFGPKVTDGGGVLGNYISGTGFGRFLQVPAVDAGILYAVMGTTLNAWTAAIFAPLWNTPAAVGASPATANGIVYLAVPGGSLAAVQFTNGAVVTLWSIPCPVCLAPIVSGGIVYVGSTETTCTQGFLPNCTSTGRFSAIDAAVGTVKWSMTTAKGFLPQEIPAITGALIIVPGPDGILYFLDKLTGSEVWRYTGASPFGPVIVGGGMVYTSDLTFTVYAFKPT